MNSNLRPTSLAPLPHAVRNRPRPCPFYALALLALVLGAFPLQGDLRLEIAPSGTNALLTWSNSAAALEQSLVLTGAWNEVAGATSPYLVLTTNISSFYRLRQAAGGPFDFRYLAPTFTMGLGDPAGCGCTSPENPNSLSTGGSAQDNGLGSVFLHTGELTHHPVDLAIPGRGMDWKFERRYRSGMQYDGPLGHGWDFNYNQRLVVQANGDVLRVDGLGRVDRYVFSGGSYQSPSGFYTRLTRNLDGIFDERDRHGTVDSYSATDTLGVAKLTRIRDRNGNQMTFGYNANGQLTNVVDTLGRSITYTYDGSGRLTQVMDFTGRTLQFGYDAEGNLAGVTSPAVTGTPNGNDFPLGKTTRYTYSSGFGDSRFNHNLLTVTAPNEVAVSGPPRLVAQYDTNPASTNADRVLSLTLGGTNASGIGAGGTLNFDYARLGTAPSNDVTTAVSQTTVTNRNGNVSQYYFNALFSVVQMVHFTQGLRPGEPPGFTNQFEYNQDGETTRQVFPEGNSAEYTYDNANPDRFQQGNLLRVLRLPGPRGGDQAQLVTTNIYETNFNFAATATDARGNTTTHAYDERGNLTNTVHRLPSITERWEVNAFGQVTAHVLPDNGSGHRRRDVMTYYSSGPQTGYPQARVVDSGGFSLTTTYEYDAVGNVTRAVDARGNDTLYTVNAFGQVVRERSRAVNTTNGPVRYQRDFFYDANDNLVRTAVENRDENGLLDTLNPALSTSYGYDILDDRLSATQEVDTANSVVTAYAYDPSQNLALTRLGEATAGRQPDNVVQRVYDERGLLFREIRAPRSSSQSTTQTDYDSNGNPVRTAQGTEDGGGQATTYAYDGYDRRVSSTDPMGNLATRHYDPNGNQMSERLDGELTDVPGSAANVRLSETTYTYDAMDRRVRADTAFFDLQTQVPVGDGLATTITIYSDNSQVLTTVDDNNHGTTNRYDTANRLSEVTDAKANTVSHTYDANGNTVATVEVDKSDLGNPDVSVTTRFAYDGLNRRTEIMDNLSQTNRVAYDSSGNVVLQVNARGNVTRYTYDGLNRRLGTERFMTSSGDGHGSLVGSIIMRQAWDDSSRLLSQTDGNTNLTAYAYDALNRRIVIVHADGTTNAQTYDVHDNPLTVADANGTVATSAYDLLNRLTNNHVAPGPGIVGTTNEDYAYDGLARLVRAQDDDSVVTRRYDSLGHLTQEAQQALPAGPARTVASTYDAVGNKTQCIYPGGRTLNYAYDALNRRSRVIEGAGPGSIASYAYLGLRRMERRDYANSNRLDMTYDGLRRPITTQHTRAGGGVPPLIDRRDYAWDPMHNKTAFNASNSVPAELHSFSYDSRDRLVNSQTRLGLALTSITYVLDDAGNRLAVTNGPDAGAYAMDAMQPAPADFQVNQYTQTPANRREYDANGNLTGTFSSPRSFAYDFRNQCSAFFEPALGLNVLFHYDVLGRRTEKIVNGIVQRFYYDGEAEIEEQNQAGNTVATYVWGIGREGLLQMTRGGQRGFYHCDDRGSVLKVTTSTGQLIEQYRYGDYGQAEILDASGTPLAQSAIANPYLYVGARYETESGFYWQAGRYLDPAAGRFITRDPSSASQAAASGNLYSFARENSWTYGENITTGIRSLCCCPKSIKLANDTFLPPHEVTKDGKTFQVYGNQFDVVVEVEMIQAPWLVRPEACTLDWQEKCDDPPGVFGDGKKPASNEWYHASSLLPDSGTIKNWRTFEKNSKQKGDKTIPMTDTPVQLEGKDRTLLFDITVRKPKDCPCGLVEGQNPYVNLKATQTLKAKGKNGGPEGKVTEGWPAGETGPP